MRRGQHGQKVEDPEEEKKRQEWRERLRNLPSPEPPDEAQITRFMSALEEHRAESDREKAVQESLKKRGNGAPGWTRAGTLIPDHLQPTHGDAYEGPEADQDGDIPPPPEV